MGKKAPEKPVKPATSGASAPGAKQPATSASKPATTSPAKQPNAAVATSGALKSSLKGASGSDATAKGASAAAGTGEGDKSATKLPFSTLVASTIVATATSGALKSTLNEASGSSATAKTAAGTGEGAKSAAKSSSPISASAKTASDPDAVVGAKSALQLKSLTEIGTILMTEVAHESDPISYLVVDESERIQAFLRNRDTNYVNVMDVATLKADKIRFAVVSALRFDKLLVFGKNRYFQNSILRVL